MKNIKLHPISRATCSWWRQQSYPSKPIKISKRLAKKLNKAIQMAEECIRHQWDYALTASTYRKYRRGKNRCINCGCKLVEGVKCGKWK